MITVILPSHLPAPYSFFDNLLKKWSGWRDLNSRPLTPELKNHFYNTFKISVYKYLVFPLDPNVVYSGLKVTVILPSKGGV